MRAQRGDNREGGSEPSVELRPGRAIGARVGEGPIVTLISPDSPLPSGCESRFSSVGVGRVRFFACELMPGEPPPQPLPWRAVGELQLIAPTGRAVELQVELILWPEVLDARVELVESGVAVEERFDL